MKLTHIQKLWIERGKLITQYASLLRACKSTELVSAKLTHVTNKIILWELRQEKKRAA